MSARTISTLTFCVIGFCWLVLASILGLAALVGLIQGTPLPSWVRALHVHAVLVGGVAQIILGGFLLIILPPGSADRNQADSHSFSFWALNGGVMGMLVGFGLHQPVVVSVAGFVVIAAFVSVIYTIWVRARRVWRVSIKEHWYYALSLVCLIGGSAFGEVMALGFATESYGYVRLAHIHLVVLGFAVLGLIGMMHHLLPTVWSRPFVNPILMRLATTLIPIGVAVLIGGFLHSSIVTELTAGAILFAGMALLTINLFRTWLSSDHSGSAASDHLLIGTFFLMFTVLLGVAVGANHLSSPPVLTYGRLHLAAYTHMTFIGFIMSAIMGLLSYLVPITLARSRIMHPKKRGPYLEQLSRVMDRGRTIQISTLSLGTMGLGILATLTWNVPLTSLYVQIAMWTSFGLVLTSLVLFSVKLTSIITRKPDRLRTEQASADELKLTA
jgi:hypothetical protein